MSIAVGNVSTYDPAQVTITIGTQSISGFADGTFVMVAREDDTFKKYVGADGTVARAKTNNFSGSFTFTLMQTSPSNSYLSAIMTLDENTNGGVVPILINDLSGSSTYFAASAWIRKPPDSSFAREVLTREWVFDAAAITMTIGGTNATAPATTISS